MYMLRHGAALCADLAQLPSNSTPQNKGAAPPSHLWILYREHSSYFVVIVGAGSPKYSPDPVTRYSQRVCLIVDKVRYTLRVSKSLRQI